MDEHPPLHSSSNGVYGDGDPQSTAEPTEGGDPPEDRSDGVENSGEHWRKSMKEQRRASLRAKVDKIIREIRTPLRNNVREHVLPRLPVKSLLRFKSVSTDWRRSISAPIFHHTQSHTHRSASGVFWQLPYGGAPVYTSFDPLAGGVPDPSLAFLPNYASISVLASSNGLLCCASYSTYYICNPSTAEWTSVPELLRPHVGRPSGVPVAYDGCNSVVLVFEPSATNLEADYHIVRPFEVSPDCVGLYGFQVFSSSARVWQVSLDLCVAEMLIPGSGVSAGGAACWRTSMQTVIVYDPMADRCRSVPWPMGYDATAQWQLGEMGGRLCCVCVTDRAVEVYALATGDWWSLRASYRVGLDEDDGEEMGVVFRSRPLPLRFQSGGSEVLLLVAERVVGLDVASGRMREACVASDGPWMSPSAEEYVPHISTFARVFPMAGGS